MQLSPIALMTADVFAQKHGVRGCTCQVCWLCSVYQRTEPDAMWVKDALRGPRGEWPNPGHSTGCSQVLTRALPLRARRAIRVDNIRSDKIGHIAREQAAAVRERGRPGCCWLALCAWLRQQAGG